MHGPLGEGYTHRSVRYAEAEGVSREGRAARIGEEDDEAVSRSYHDTVLSGKLRQATRQKPTGRREYISSRMNNSRKTGNWFMRFSVSSTRTPESPPMENPRCVAFEEYGEVP